MKKISTFKSDVATTFAAMVLVAMAVNPAWGASGTWTNDASGAWGGTANWQGGVVADGDTFVADFSTINITADRTVTLDGAHTISTLVFGDSTSDHNWMVTGANTLTLGTLPVINVVNQTVTFGNGLAGTTGMTKVGAGALTFMGTNTYSGGSYVLAGTVNYSGSSAYGLAGSDYNVSNGVVNISTAGSLTFSNNFPLGGLNGNASPNNGSAVVNQTSGTVSACGSGGRYLEIGVGTNAYGRYNLSGGTLNTPNASGIRVGATGTGIFNQSGGTLNCSRYFSVGTSTTGGEANTGGRGVATFTGGTASLGASGYKAIIGDKASCFGVLNVGTEAGGNATVTAASPSSGNGGVEFLDRVNASGTLNLNSGTLNTIFNIYQANAGPANFNFNGGKLQAGGNNNLISATAPVLNVYKNGAVIDSQGFITAILSPLLAAAGNGIYPAGGTLAVPSNGGSGYLDAPLVTISGGSGSNALAIANVSGGVVTGVTLTCPGQNYAAGNLISFAFTGGGAATPASTFNYTLAAGDLAANSTGGLTKQGSGTLALSVASTYGGNTLVSAGTLDVKADNGLGSGNVTVAGGAVLILENGATNGYINSAANLVLGSSSAVNLNFSGANTINGLSLDGGLTYQAPGTWGAVGSGASNQDSRFTGGGILNVLTTPVVNVAAALNSSVNPSAYGQPVTFTATVNGNSGIPTGTVTFMDGATSLITVTLNGSGMAAFTTNSLSVGAHSMTAVYNGGDSYGPATSTPLTQNVVVGTNIWTGAVNGVWDINATTNWTYLGNPAKYQDGNNAQLDDSATGTTAITLGVTVNPLTLLFSNTTKAYSMAGAGSIGGAVGLTKIGTNLLTLNLANAYTGTTLVSNGIVTFGTNSANSGNGSFIVGGAAGRSVVNINTTNTLSFNGSLGVGGNVGDTSDTGVGAVNQNSGTFSSGGGGNAYIEIGAGGSAVYGVYNLSGGTFNTFNTSGVRVGATGTGVYVQSGGFLNCSRYFAVGTQSGVNNIGGVGMATFTGGAALFSSAYRVIIGDKSGATGVLNLGTGAGGNAVLTNLYNNAGNGGIELIDNVGANSGVLNLNSGILQIGGAIWRPSGAVGTATLNFNGATLQAGANNISLVTNVNSFLTGDFTASLFSRGIVLDSMANTCSMDADIRATGGNGIYPAVGRLPVTDGGAGYIGSPIVAVSGGSGSGAMAVATTSNGVITSVAMTCPGQNYQAGDVVSFDFTSGGATPPAGTFSYTLQAGDLLSNAAGGITKIGAGQLSLNGFNNDYAGATVVSNGTLVIAGSLTGGGAVNVQGGLLGGSGSISGQVTVNTGGTLTAGIADVGTLTINNNLTFTPGAAFSAKINKSALTHDLVQGVTHLTYAGTLVVTNLSGSLTNGDSFKLFDATTYSGTFSSIVPATPGTGLAWDTSQLVTNGTLNVMVGAAINPNPTNIVFNATNNFMNLSWPADHTGWHLQAQTNALSIGLRTNWVDVTGSTLTNKMSFPINPANGSVFYRLSYP